MCQIYPRSFADSDGCDISDYQDIEPVFGTLARFDELLAAVHEHGMRLVLDVVFNRTSDEQTGQHYLHLFSRRQGLVVALVAGSAAASVCAGFLVGRRFR